MDGYDEYQPGTNKEIDRAIDATVGNCLLLLTSRPGYLQKQTRDKMDGEITIEGFSRENVAKCSELFLGTKQKREEMMEQVEKSGIEDLLKVPIMLLMVCTLFLEKKKLPETKTEIVGTIFKLAMDRSTLKSFGKTSSDVDLFEESLMALGKLSWQALQKDVQQLLLNKVSKADKRVYLKVINEDRTIFSTQKFRFAKWTNFRCPQTPSFFHISRSRFTSLHFTGTI